MATSRTQFTVKAAKGGNFLIEDAQPEEQVFYTVEDFTDEQRQIAKTTAEFYVQRG